MSCKHFFSKSLTSSLIFSSVFLGPVVGVSQVSAMEEDSSSSDYSLEESHISRKSSSDDIWGLAEEIYLQNDRRIFRREMDIEIEKERFVAKPSSDVVRDRVQHGFFNKIDSEYDSICELKSYSELENKAKELEYFFLGLARILGKHTEFNFPVFAYKAAWLAHVLKTHSWGKSFYDENFKENFKNLRAVLDKKVKMKFMEGSDGQIALDKVYDAFYYLKYTVGRYNKLNAELIKIKSEWEENERLNEEWKKEDKALREEKEKWRNKEAEVEEKVVEWEKKNHIQEEKADLIKKWNSCKNEKPRYKIKVCNGNKAELEREIEELKSKLVLEKNPDEITELTVKLGKKEQRLEKVNAKLETAENKLKEQEEFEKKLKDIDEKCKYKKKECWYSIFYKEENEKFEKEVKELETRVKSENDLNKKSELEFKLSDKVAAWKTEVERRYNDIQKDRSVCFNEWEKHVTEGYRIRKNNMEKKKFFEESCTKFSKEKNRLLEINSENWKIVEEYVLDRYGSRYLDINDCINDDQKQKVYFVFFRDYLKDFLVSLTCTCRLHKYLVPYRESKCCRSLSDTLYINDVDDYKRILFDYDIPYEKGTINKLRDVEAYKNSKTGDVIVWIREKLEGTDDFSKKFVKECCDGVSRIRIIRPSNAFKFCVNDSELSDLNNIGSKISEGNRNLALFSNAEIDFQKVNEMVQEPNIQVGVPVGKEKKCTSDEEIDFQKVCRIVGVKPLNGVVPPVGTERECAEEEKIDRERAMNEAERVCFSINNSIFELLKKYKLLKSNEEEYFSGLFNGQKDSIMFRKESDIEYLGKNSYDYRSRVMDDYAIGKRMCIPIANFSYDLGISSIISSFKALSLPFFDNFHKGDLPCLHYISKYTDGLFGLDNIVVQKSPLADYGKSFFDGFGVENMPLSVDTYIPFYEYFRKVSENNIFKIIKCNGKSFNKIDEILRESARKSEVAKNFLKALRITAFCKPLHKVALSMNWGEKKYFLHYLKAKTDEDKCCAFEIRVRSDRPRRCMTYTRELIKSINNGAVGIAIRSKTEKAKDLFKYLRFYSGLDHAFDAWNWNKGDKITDFIKRLNYDGYSKISKKFIKELLNEVR